MALDTRPDEDQGAHDKLEGGLQPDETEVTDPREMRDQARQEATNQFSRNFGQKVGQWAGQNKRKLAVGGIAGGVITAIIAGFFALLPLKLLHFKELLHDRNFAVGENFERNRTYRMLRNTLKGPKLDRNGRRVVQCFTGGFICDKVTNWNLNRFEEKMRRRGIRFEYGADGRLTRITRIDPATGDPRPDPRTGVADIDLDQLDDISRKNALFGALDEAIPSWRVGKRIKYRALMSRRTGVPWKFFRKAGEAPDPDDPDMRTRVDERVKGTDAETARVRADTDPNFDPDGDGTPNNSQDAIDAGDDLGSIANEAQDAARENGTSIRAETARASRGRMALRGVGITGLIAAVCGIQDLLNSMAGQIVVERTLQLIQNGNLLLVNASHLADGQLDGQDLNDFMRLFEGWETMAIVDEQGNDTGQTKTVYAGAETSVAYKVVAEEPVTQYDRQNRDLSEDAHPSSSAVGRIKDAVNSIISFVPGGQLLCDVATNVVGQIVMGIVEIGVAIFSGGSSAAAGVAASFGAQEAFSRLILPRIIALVINASVGGFTDGFQMFSNMDAGLALSATEYSDNIGGNDLTGDEYERQYTEVKRLYRQEFQEKSLAYRLFAKGDHQSLLSRLSVHAPATPQTAVAKIASLPRAFGGFVFSALTGAKPVLAEGEPSRFGSENRYNFKLSGFTEQELAAYEWDTNESYQEQVIGNRIVPPECAVVEEHRTRKRWEIMELGYDYYVKVLGECNPNARKHVLGYGEACYDQEYTGSLELYQGAKPDHPYTDENSAICDTLGRSPDGGDDYSRDTIDPITNADIRQDLFCPGASGNCGGLTELPHFSGDTYTPANLSGGNGLTEMLAYRLYRLDRHIACNYETALSDENPSSGCPQPPGNISTAGSPGIGPGAVTDPTQDTSAQPCQVGTDGGVHSVERRDSGGNVTATFNIRVCIVRGVDVNVSIERQFDQLMAAASSAGHNFGGGGFRSYQEQIALRRSNCGTSNYAIYQMSPSQCSPPTARPGQSMHEVGLAIDFTSGGSTLRSGTPGFNWLVSNAASFGFYNLPSESWHWSTSGG